MAANGEEALAQAGGGHGPLAQMRPKHGEEVNDALLCSPDHGGDGDDSGEEEDGGREG